MDKEIKTFENLEAYKTCREYKTFIIQTVIPKLLSNKEYDLVNQIKRASRSITANIAEGYGRYHYMDNSKFCSIARGSLYETLEHTITANDENLITNEDLERSKLLFESAIKPLNGYINYLFKSANQTKSS